MIRPFLATAVQSPGRQFALRAMVAFHLIVLAGCVWLLHANPFETVPKMGLFLLLAGIVEGALLIGWRLTQIPKTRALEFLLASPLTPSKIFLTEFLVGSLRLFLITLSGLPVLALLLGEGMLEPNQLIPILLLPLLWGLITGLALTTWAYEPEIVRKVGEKILMAGILVYLVVGVLAGEKLQSWLEGLPGGMGGWVISSFYWFHAHNPFAEMQGTLRQTEGWKSDSFFWFSLVSFLGILVLMVRAAFRFLGHYRDRHFSPIVEKGRKSLGAIGVRPLSWWAVKRVSEYSGRVNLWLAGGFGVLYALHLMAGPNWPSWMGRGTFVIFDRFFGVGGVITALVILAAVPAAFQYGLWDSNTQDRCRRLELLLLTKLTAFDYWLAAFSAAWRRGRGYFAIAGLLWIAAVVGGKLFWVHACLALLAAVMLWMLYFALGFRSFATGAQANNMGLFLTVGLPLGTVALFQSGFRWLAFLTPPGSIYVFSAGNASFQVIGLLGMIAIGGLALYIHRNALRQCETNLRRWYEKFHGQKTVG